MSVPSKAFLTSLRLKLLGLNISKFKCLLCLALLYLNSIFLIWKIKFVQSKRLFRKLKEIKFILIVNSIIDIPFLPYWPLPPYSCPSPGLQLYSEYQHAYNGKHYKHFDVLFFRLLLLYRGVMFSLKTQNKVSHLLR